MRKTNLKWLMSIIMVISFAFYGNAQIIFQDDFSTDQAWTLNGSWERDTAVAEPAADHTGLGDNNILSNPLGVDYPADMSREDVVSPVFDCSTYTSIELSYWSFSGCETSSWDHMGVEVYDGSAWVEIWSNASSFQETDWTYYMFDVTSYAAGNANFQVRFYMGITDGSVYYSGFAIDDFKLENITCPQPTDLLSSNVSLTEATLSWTSGLSETAWNVEWDTAGFTQGTGNILNLTDTFTVLSGLTSGTAYQYYVQADCGAGDESSWVGPYTFLTPNIGDACTAPLTISLPADFTANVYQDLAQTTVGRGNNSDTTCLGGYDGGEDIFYELTLTSDMVINVELDPKTTTWTGIALTSDCPSSTNCIETSTNSSATPHGFQQVHLAAGTYFIIIDTYPTPDNIPDFDLTITLVTCPNPMDLGVTFNSATSVDLTWTTGGSSTWNVLFDTLGFDTTGLGPLANDILTNPLTVDTLQPETSYEFYVRDVCGASDSSEWIGPFQFTTTEACPTPTDLNAFGVTAHEVYLTWNGYFATNWDILFGETGFDTTGLAPTVNDYNNDTLYVDTLTQVTSYEFYVRADCGQNDIDTSYWVGPFSFTTEVSCPAPTALNVTDITDVTATLSWTPGGASDFNIVYGIQGFTMTDSTAIAVTDTFYAVTGLVDGTAYEFYVQDFCGVGDESTWSGPYSFATDCGITTPEYLVDFSTYLPMCWGEAQGQLDNPTSFSSTTSSNWLADGFANIGSTGSARINVYSTNRFEWLISKSIDLGTSGSYQLEFDLALTDYANHAAPDQNGTDDKFAVVISTDNGITWNLSDAIRLWDNAGSSYVYNDIPYTGQHVVIDLSSYTGVVKFGMYAESTVSNADNDLFVDNFRVRTIPSCPEPYSLAAQDITMNDATVSWTPYGSESEWNVQYDTAGFTLGTGVIVNVTDTFTTLNTLSPGVTYDFYVQGVCGAGDSSVWAGSYTFNTFNLGDACSASIQASLPADFISNVWEDLAQTTVGRGNTNDTTCLDSYDGGEDIFYEFTVTEDMVVNITFDPKTTTYTGIALASDCPSMSNCILSSTNSGVTVHYFDEVYLTAGSYFIMIDTYPLPDNIPDFDLIIERVTCPKPTDLGVENLMATSVELAWTTGGSLEWDILFGVSPFDTTGVAYSTTTYNPLTVDTLTPETTYEYYVRDACSPTDTSYWVGPFQFTTTATCPVPTDLGLANLGTTSADLSWNGYFATTWDILFGVAGFDTTGLAPTVDDATDNPFTVDTLTQNTSYEFYVRADCGSDSSIWTGPYTFTTYCDAITTYPYIESFETGAYSGCWNQTASGTGLVWSVETSGTYPTVSPYDGAYLAKLNCYSASSGETILSTVNFDLTGQSNPHLNFFMVHDDGYSASDDRIIIQITTDGSTWTNIDTISRYQAITATWTEYDFDLSAYIGQTISIGFDGFTEWGNNIFIDKVMIYNQMTDLTIVNPGNFDYSSCYYTGQDTIPFNVENVGSTIVAANDTIYGWYEIDGATAVADTFILATDLNPSEIATFNFAQTADLAGMTTHNFKVYLDYIDDEVQLNDTTMGTFTHYLSSVSINQGDTVIISSSDFPYLMNISGTYDSVYWHNADSSLTGGYVQFVVNDFGWYYVTIRDTNGCSASDSIFVENITSISYTDNELIFEVYPNPSNGQFVINAKFVEKQDVVVDIIDINGKVVYSNNFDNIDAIRQDVDIKQYAKGVYYIRLSNESFIHQEKIVIQ